MRCDEIQERFVELLYDERGTPPASPELRAHVLTCASCRRELEELRTVRGVLGLWKDEAPRDVVLPASARLAPVAPIAPIVTIAPIATRFRSKPRFVAVARWGAIAAMLVMALLALGNADVTWNRDGFAFRTRLFAQEAAPADYYTKGEVRRLVKLALDDTERSMTEANYVMMQRLLETIDQEKQEDMRFLASRFRR